MTKEETAMLIGQIAEAYPTTFNFSEERIVAIVNTWQRILEDQEYARVLKGLDKYVKNDSKGYAPTIGQILQYVPYQTPIMRAPKGWEGL